MLIDTDILPFFLAKHAPDTSLYYYLNTLHSLRTTCEFTGVDRKR